LENVPARFRRRSPVHFGVALAITWKTRDRGDKRLRRCGRGVGRKLRMEKITAILRQARESKGVSLEEVETATRIPRKYLQALEGGGDSRLLADEVYLIPFLRVYANFLGMDPTRAVTWFLEELQRNESRALVPIEHRPVPPPRSASSRLSSWALPFLLLLGALGVSSFVWKQGEWGGIDSWWQSWRGNNEFSAQSQSSSSPEPTTTADTSEPPPERSAPATAPLERSPSTVPSSTSVVQGAYPTAAPSPVSPTPPQVESPSVSTSAPRPPLPTEGVVHRLSVQAKTAAWVRIAVDGQPSKDMILKPGETREWSAQEGFTLSLGNAGGVILNLDGQELPPVGKSGQVIRNLQIPAVASTSAGTTQ